MEKKKAMYIFKLQLVKLSRSGTVKTVVCYTQFLNVCKVVTEMHRPTNPIKISSVFARF